MAKVVDTTSTSGWIPLDEALARAGSVEALLPHLGDGRVPAQHQGLYYWPNGKTRSGPGEIGRDWWATARVDPATGRVIFLRPSMYRLVGNSAPAAAGPPITDEVFAFGVELARAAVEALWPAPPEREHVEAPVPTRPAGRKMEPKVWLAWALKEYPLQPGEQPGVYTRRLHGLMQKADNVTEVWEFGNLRRRYYYEAAQTDR